MSPTAHCPSLAQRINNIDWPSLEQNLEQDGSAIIRNLLTARQCRMLSGLYAEPGFFRSRVIMARHGFGRGEYQYFRYPLPDAVQQLRQSLYPALVPLANRWNECLGIEVRYPNEHPAFIQRCHAAGQRRPTPLLLQYGPQDYNCLHQDLYGEHVFPLQVAILLSEPGQDFSGGEFVLTEQRPRMQSRAQVIDLKQGDALVFAVHQRPVKGVRGYYRVNLRHGVSRVHSGSRHTLGIIFHDAQ
ncbi:2OG-Fe(II) oxygenase [Pseudomonas hefeiensis]|uniref:2OG-Fe(II) oxygenase n=1 Tax=Pseudomonas hefeiensis TaxID=2738125 RepID=A0ABY9G4P4_9PSED|nr:MULTISPECIES: 2OG-Fe(II) oxygenase [unclassified Pseudomonas]WLH10568.1 2OG-Fe(II) oxygenase [Pseudomonas sp. FP205]WLH93646.1 2OG-Fe(II) oxygenase [Pseudomonas sp. FP53]WLI37930.1 2OG-Fe(II) oxygenase [Pseudomonas sp. FP821]